MNVVIASLEDAAASVSAWAHPQLDYANRPFKDYPLMSVQAATLCSVGYLALVAIGSARGCCLGRCAPITWGV